jgi:sodium/hydrogen exchanger 8
VFGEGITNDAVCIILFNTVMEYSGPESEFTIGTPFKIIGSFIKLSLLSVFCGVAWSIVSSLLLRNMRFLTVNPIIECNLIFCFGYLAYSTAEFIHCSGIIALLVSGILMSHYTWYNLSPQSKHVTSIAF